MVGISGTHSTRYPLAVKIVLIFYIEVLLPAHGPPVTAILYIGYSAVLRIE